MDTTRKTLVNDEVATLTGKIYMGDITPMVYELLKDTRDIKALFSYLTGGDLEYVDNKQSSTFIQSQSCNRPSVAEWLRNCEQLQ